MGVPIMAAPPASAGQAVGGRVPQDAVVRRTLPTSPALTPPDGVPAKNRTGAYAAASAPEQVLPFRARTGTIPPERPASDLAGVLPFRPAGGWAQPGLPQGLGEGEEGRLTPADPVPAQAHGPGAGQMHAQAHAQGHPQGHAQGHPQGHAQGHPQGHAQGHPQAYAQAPLDAPYPPAPPMPGAHAAAMGAGIAGSYPPVPPPPAALAPVESVSSLSAARRDALGPGGMIPGGVAELGAFGAHGQVGQASSAAPPMSPPAPAAPAPPPATLPSDAWKLVRAPSLYPFAAGPTAIAQAAAASAAAWAASAGAGAAGMGAGGAQAPPPGGPMPYADPGAVVPASLGQNAPRLTLEQYACLAAELAVAPASAAQVRQRYGLDDTMHLAEQGAWQRRFALDAQLFASYSSLFQHYRDWLNQSPRR
ncbi:MAG: hypothetical protein R3B70_28145 [Polyangiaceae bacterium]